MSNALEHNIEIVHELDARDADAIAQARRDLRETRWLSAFFNPFGQIPPVVFTRGQIMLWLVRLVVFAVGLGAGLGGDPQTGGLIVLAGFGASAIVSLIMHIQRLEHAGRPGWFAPVAVLPILFAALAAFVGLQGINMKIEAARRAAIEAAANPQASAAAPADALDAAPAASAQAKPSRPGRGGPPGRGGQGGGGQPPLPVWVLMGLPVWLLAGLIVNAFTWGYAARVKPRT